MATTSASAPALIDRVDIHKSCKSLEAIVSVLTSYTEAANVLATVQKKLAKALKDAASVKGTNNVPANAMANSAAIFEALAEVDSKFAKIADRETENVGSDLKKWFKRLAKEEKAHDERITNANAKIKQAGQAYEKKAKKKDRDASDEHTRYVAILSAVGPEMSQDKYNHSLIVTQRHTMALSGFAATMSRLAEAEWARACENVRRSASSIGSVGEWRALCEGGWSAPVPADLPDIGTIEYERDRRSNDGVDKSREAMRTLMLPQPIGPAYTHESPESPTSPPKPSLSSGRSSEGHSVVEHSTPYNIRSRPPSPPAPHDATPHTLKKKPVYSEHAHGLSVSPTTQLVPQAGLGSNAGPSGSLSNAFGSASLLPPLTEDDRSPRISNDDRGLLPMARRPHGGQGIDPDGTVKPETKAGHPPVSQDPLPPFSSRESFTGERNRADIAPMNFVDERERERPILAPSPVNAKQAVGGKNGDVTGAILDRRTSVESTTSNNSLVATMRDRYDTRPAKPSSPPPRDLPRLAQSVTDLATRYTPADSPVTPHRTPVTPSAQASTSADRFPTFQDRYPRASMDKSDRDRDRDRYRVPPGSPGPGSGPDRDERPRYVESPTVDRNRFLRDDRDRERYRRPYADELGLRRIDTVEERALQEREADLREQERQLDLERARLREAGYASDTTRRAGGTAYVPQRSESPGTYDHSPNCGCQRCSAQHYAASTPTLARAQPERPIQLRPEKPKNWIRRMSMPVASLVSSGDKKSPGASSVVGQNWGNMALPEEDGRIMRRSFELERDREMAAKFGGTTRR